MSVGSPPQSYNAIVGLGKESSYNSVVSPTYFVDAVSDGYELDGGVSSGDGGTRDRQTHKQEAGAFSVDGGWDAPANPEGGFGLVLAAAFGAESLTELTTGESYEHAYTPSPTLPSLTVQIDNDQTNIQYGGVWIDQLELSHTSEERLAYSVDAPAAEPHPGGSAMSPSYSALRNFWFHDATISIGGVQREADLTDLTHTFSNNGDALHRENRTASKADLGQFEAEVEATLDFESQEAFESVLGSSGATSVQSNLTPIAYKATWTSPSVIGSSTDQYLLEVEMPEVFVSTHGANINERDLVAEDVTIVPRVDQSGTISDMVEVRLQNSVSTTY